MQVPLGFLLHNENKLDKMSEILTHCMTLVPTLLLEGHHTLPNSSIIDIDDTRFHELLIGGDQLTVARICGAQAIHATHDKHAECFEGLVPVVEDWHARMTLMQVSIGSYMYMYVSIF